MCQLGGPVVLGETEEGPCTFAEAGHEPSFGEKPEVARNAWLRLAQDVGQIRNSQFGFDEERENAQPRLLTGSLQRGIEIIEPEAGRRGHGIAPNRNRYIKIYLYGKVTSRKRAWAEARRGQLAAYRGPERP